MYGDRGNIICLKKRLEWRGIDCKVTRVGIGDEVDFTQHELFFIGGGQDLDQEVILPDLKAGKDKEIKAAIEDGKTFLCICAGYQIMGHYYETASGTRQHFLGAIDFHTIHSETRMVGNYTFDLGKDLGGLHIVGFENHSGQTYLGQGASPLGTVIKGYGNNGKDRTEGVRYHNVFGSYCHGPILPKNPAFCDLIIQTALERKYGRVALTPLEDTYENMVHDKMIDRLLKRREI